VHPQPLEPRQPTPFPQKPALVPAKPRRRGPWLLMAALVAAGGAALWFARNMADTGSGGPPVAALRTATVAVGPVEQSVRITGTTGAEKYASVLTPMMRGSRSGFGRTGLQTSFSVRGSGGGGGMMMMAMTVTTGGGGGFGGGGGGDRGDRDRGGGGRGSESSSGGSSSSSGGGSGTAATIASTSSAASGGGSAALGGFSSTSALRAATSRTGSSQASAARSRGSSSGGSRTSGGGGSMGSGGMGSTAGSLPGGGGGGPGGGGGGPGGGPGGGGGGPGGGGGDFQMTVQNLVKPGSIVKKGDVVAEFDNQYMVSRLDDYRATMTQSDMSHKKMMADLEVTRKSHEQSIGEAKADLDKALLNLKTTPVLSAIDAERMKLAAEEADARHKQLLKEVQYVRTSEQADIRVADLEIQQAKVELKRAEANAERMMLKAPIDGMVVMESNFRGGEFDQLKEGDQLFPGQPLLRVVDLSSMVVNAFVNQVDGEKIRVGQRANVRFDAFPGLVLPARVRSIGAVPKTSRSRPDFLKEIPVALKLEKTDPRIIPDLSVSADIVLETAEQVSIAPREAVFSSDDGTRYVYVKRAQGWERRPVKPGLANHVVMAVPEGLSAGEVIALEPPGSQRR